MTNMKTNPLDREVALELAQDFLSKMEFFINEESDPTVSDLGKYLASSFRVTINGKTIANSLNEYLEAIKLMREKYSHVEIGGLAVDVLSSGYEMTARYSVSLTERSSQSKKRIEFFAVAALEDDKFIGWDEVAGEYGAVPR